jgi:hypothetical protein
MYFLFPKRRGAKLESLAATTAHGHIFQGWLLKESVVFFKLKLTKIVFNYCSWMSCIRKECSPHLTNFFLISNVKPYYLWKEWQKSILPL